MGLRRSSHRSERPIRRIPVRWDLLARDLCDCLCHVKYESTPHRNQACKCHPTYKAKYPLDDAAPSVVQLNQREASDGTG